jgi:hypothetical protein
MLDRLRAAAVGAEETVAAQMTTTVTAAWRYTVHLSHAAALPLSALTLQARLRSKGSSPGRWVRQASMLSINPAERQAPRHPLSSAGYSLEHQHQGVTVGATLK